VQETPVTPALTGSRRPFFYFDLVCFCGAGHAGRFLHFGLVRFCGACQTTKDSTCNLTGIGEQANYSEHELRRFGLAHAYCTWCDFLPVCLKNAKRIDETW